VPSYDSFVVGVLKIRDSSYFTYLAVEELIALCQRRKLIGVTEEFLDSFMEPIQRYQ